jgi:hypothetical protein
MDENKGIERENLKSSKEKKSRRKALQIDGFRGGI